MNRIITGDERNVKNLETKVCISWGMSFKDRQISLQKANLKHTLLSAGNVTYAIRQPSERRIVSGDPPPTRHKKGYRKLKPVAVSFKLYLNLY